MFKVHFNNLNYTTSEISQILMIQERDYKEFYSNTDSYLRISI